MKRWRRRSFLRSSLAIAGLSLLSGCSLPPLPGQRTTNLRRVGFLDIEAGTSRIGPFREGMRELGYVEGQNLVIEYRGSQGSAERLPALATELVNSQVEVIVTSNPSATFAAAQATSVIPIVVAGGNIVATGLVTNIAHPEGNVTGVTTGGAAAVAKWIELLKGAVPTLSRLAVVGDPRTPNVRAYQQAVGRAAQVLELQFTWYDLGDLDNLSDVLATVTADGADGLVLVSGGTLAAGSDPRIGEALLNYRLPAIAESRPFAVNGGLLAHATDGSALAKRAASYVDKILKGAQPGDLPIELPTTFEILVNLRTAQALGITMPASVLAQATEVIQ